MSMTPVLHIAASDVQWSNFLTEVSKHLEGDRLGLWTLDRAHSHASAFVVRDSNGELKSALLEAGRQKTNYRKIIDFFVADESELAALLNAAIENSKDSHCISIKCEEHSLLHAFSSSETSALTQAGFRRESDPVQSVPSTRGAVRSWTKWFTREPQRPVTYYGQTTDVTCGAGTTLMAIESHGGETFLKDDSEFNREIELEVWRSATNMPACEPVGLAVTTHQRIATVGANLGKPTVYLSTSGTSLLEWYKDFDYNFREQLQRESFKKADQLGIPVIREWISTQDIVAAIVNGNLVYLLIDLTVMLNDPTPHWVLAHDVIENCVVISDPWVDSKTGETWVDCSNLPVNFTTLDDMTRWGEPAYRGVVIVPKL